MTVEPLLLGTLGVLLVAAVLVVTTDRLFTAVVYGGVLSAAAAFCYLLLGAPDVALAEAVIGSTLSTIVFLVTLKKYRIFTIYVLPQPGQGVPGMNRVLSVIERALQKQEIEPHLMQSNQPAHTLLAQPDCELVVEQLPDTVMIHGEQSSKYLQLIELELAEAGLSQLVRLEDSMADRVAEYKGGDG